MQIVAEQTLRLVERIFSPLDLNAEEFGEIDFINDRTTSQENFP